VPLLPGAEPFSAPGGSVGVLLSHGFTGHPGSMRPWAEHLAAQGYAVELPRLPGHGTTWQELNLTRWTDWYAEVSHGLDRLRSRCEQVFVMGLSMGGTLALRLAEERPDEVAGLVLVNPSVLTKNPVFPLVPVLKWVVPAVKGVGDDIKKPGASEDAYPRTPLRALASLGALWKLVRADLGKVTVPVLLYRSAEDHVVEPENAAAILEGVSSTDVREVVLTDSYHVATLDNDAEAIFAGSVDFVRSHSAQPSPGPAR
jgi:carboxylesterase